MMAINVKRIVEVSVDMTLDEQQAGELLDFLRTAVTVTAPRPMTPGSRPTNIVRELADALIAQGVVSK